MDGSSGARPLASLIAVVGAAAMGACFNPDPLPQDPDTTSGASTGGPASTSGPVPSSSSGDVVSTTGVDPDSSSGVADTGSSSGGGMESSSSGEPPMPVCGDGLLDLATETCDDGNLEDGDLCDSSCQVETMVFAHTGGPQEFAVPAWVDSLVVEAWGAQGGGAECCQGPVQQDGGLGGYVTGELPTIGGITIVVNVGGQGITGGPGGFNGGGDGGQWGAGGGGATDVRLMPGGLDNRLLVAAGGGGGNCGCPDFGTGGAGGGLVGAPGIALQGNEAPGGGTQMAGGLGGFEGSPGILGMGGSAADGDLYHVAGGGGGLYGGGGGETVGGGGGSSSLGLLQDADTQPGMHMGDGELAVTPIALR